MIKSMFGILILTVLSGCGMATQATLEKIPEPRGNLIFVVSNASPNVEVVVEKMPQRLRATGQSDVSGRVILKLTAEQLDWDISDVFPFPEQVVYVVSQNRGRRVLGHYSNPNKPIQNSNDIVIRIF